MGFARRMQQKDLNVSLKRCAVCRPLRGENDGGLEKGHRRRPVEAGAVAQRARDGTGVRAQPLEVRGRAVSGTTTALSR